MISWISGKLIEYWEINQKFFILINCQGLGYEIQILESSYLQLKMNHATDKNLTLWIKHIKKEDSDLFFGFNSKDQRNFFVEILNIRGIGSQIGMALLNKFSINEIINAINAQNKKLISSVPGIGQKMSERLILELKSKFKKEFENQEEKYQDKSLIKNSEINKMLSDLELTLLALNYKKKEISLILPIIFKEIDILTIKDKKGSFENLLKVAMNYLDNDSSNIVR